MVKKTYNLEKKNPKHNQEWSWEETPELLAAIEQLHKSSEAVKNIKVPTLRTTTHNIAPFKRR